MTPRAIAVLFVLLASARADTLALRNGTTVTGTWIGVASGQIKFQVNDQIQVYPRSDVSTVTFGDSIPPPPPPIPAPPPPSDAAPEPPGNIQEPGRIGVVYFKSPTGGLVPLEQVQLPQVKLRVGLNLAYHYEIEGAKSPFRVKSRQAMLFVVSLANGIDPAIFGLYPLRIDKHTRRSAQFRNNYELRNAFKIPLELTRIGGSYGLKPARDLSTGEYCFTSFNGAGFCFGVDPASSGAGPAEESRVAVPEPSNDERPTLTRKFPAPPSDTAAPPLSNDVQEPTVIGVGGVSQPAVIQKVAPEYTKKAREAKLSGTVTLAITVDADGQARDIHVVKALGMGLDESAVESVKKWRFRPAMKDGQPVNVRATVQVNFLLDPASAIAASVEEPRVGLPNPSNDERPTLRRTSSDVAPPTIELGQTKEQIVSTLGQPERIANVGDKQIYVYKDLKVTLTDGKVTDIQ